MKRGFSDNLRRGLATEEKCLEFLAQLRGLVVEPRYAKEGTGRGPRHKSADYGSVDLVSHDLLGRFADQDFDIQVKLKGATTFWRIGAYYEHGIDTKDYENYLTTLKAKGKPLWLIIYEERAPEEGPGTAPSMLAQWFDQLPKPRHTKGHHTDQHGMVHWPRERFVHVANTLFDPPQWLIKADERVAELELRKRFYRTDAKQFALSAPQRSNALTCAICGQPIVNPGPDGVPLLVQGKHRWVHWGECIDEAEAQIRSAAG